MNIKLTYINTHQSPCIFQPSNKTLIFVQTKRLADFLTENLRQGGISAVCIHGDKMQTARDWVIAGKV